MRRLCSQVLRFAAPFLVAVLAEADGGTRDGNGAPVKRGAEVTGSQSDTSRPLKDLPPAPEKPGRRVHDVKPVPRPARPPPPDAGT